MPKGRRLSLIVIGGLLVLCGVAAFNTIQRANAATVLRAPNRSFNLEVADTVEKQELGLGQRDRLADNEGMVFVYEGERQLCFWMKDMRIPIDMIWLNSAKKVLKIEANVSPKTYPNDFCADSAQYVIELNANAAQAAGISTGQTLKF